MIKCIIVDDEPLAQEILQSFVSQLSQLELVATCSNAFEANTALRENDIDLMFLDIQMPQMNGIDFLKSLTNPPLVIYTTAYSEYAVDGFELNALDYLLKPISMDRFMKAVNKAEDRLSAQTPNKEETVLDSDEFFFVKADKKLIKVNFEDIIYIEGMKDYVMIHKNNKRIITLQTMKSLEVKLPSSIFRRIHRSYIVNLDQINAIVGNMVEVTAKNQAKHIPIGKNYRDELLALVNKKKL